MGARYLDSEAKKLFRERRNKTMLERHGVKSKTNVKKVKATKLERYGNENYNNQEKHEQTCLDRYNVPHHNQCKEIAQKISNSKKLPETQAKYEETCLERFGTINPNLNPQVRQKMNETKKKNKSFNKSKPEELYYQLFCKMYGEDNIERQYMDDRYPFECDFYIKSKDLFIEINYHPTHGKHPFTNSEEDKQLLENLNLNPTKWNENTKYVWSDLDVRKVNCAIENNLNYNVYYPDFKYEIVMKTLLIAGNSPDIYKLQSNSKE